MAVTPLQANDPQRLGDFVLTGRLGAGGMGVVYLGQGPAGESVAVKLVRADLAHDPTFRERFRREVEALRRVSGPRVAALVAADTEAAQPYLVVEYVDGPTLADSVATAGPLDGPRLRALAAALAEALVLIHEVGVIHRDLKPTNVILAADQPKLVDFGIAAAAGSMPLTMAGTVIGSAGWMAPEQAAGQVSTPAVDVFTWASLVAFAGTGRPPFGIGGPEEVTMRILSGEPDLDGLPQEVRPFVEAAFIKDPLQRPPARAVLSGLVGGTDEASTDELVAGTTNLIEHTWVLPVTGWPTTAGATPVQPPVDAPPPPRAPPVPVAASAPVAPARPHRVWLVVLVVALVCLALGAAAALLLARGNTSEEAGGTATPGPTAAIPVPTTTTTTEPPPPPLDATARLTLSADDLGDILGQIFTGDADCVPPGASVGLESADGEVLVPPTPFAEGEQVSGSSIFDSCEYTVDFSQVAGADAYLVTLSDSVGEIPPVPLTRAQIEAAGGLIDLNQLFEIDQLVDTT